MQSKLSNPDKHSLVIVLSGHSRAIISAVSTGPSHRSVLLFLLPGCRHQSPVLILSNPVRVALWGTAVTHRMVAWPSVGGWRHVTTTVGRRGPSSIVRVSVAIATVTIITTVATVISAHGRRTVSVAAKKQGTIVIFQAAQCRTHVGVVHLSFSYFSCAANDGFDI